MENKPIKLPLGIKPKRVHDAQRAVDIMAACLRYEDAWLSIPLEWIAELKDILSDQLTHYPK